LDVFCVTVAGELAENVCMAMAGTRARLVSTRPGTAVTIANIATISTTLARTATVAP
jgi:hypothetical protein